MFCNLWALLPKWLPSKLFLHINSVSISSLPFWVMYLCLGCTITQVFSNQPLNVETRFYLGPIHVTFVVDKVAL